MDANVTKTKWNAKLIALVGMMAAVTCVLGPLSIPLPISPVPISLTNFAIYLAIYVLGTKRGILSYVIYLLIGLVGLPVFSAFTGGPGKLLGPTGGYLIGFLPMALICGIFIEKSQKRDLHFIGMVIGTVIAYVFGTAWLAWQAEMTFGAALAAGVIPFIPGDLAKIIICMMIGPELRKRLRAAGLV